MIREVVIAFAAVALYGASAAAQPPDADAIFSRARDAASAQRCPARLEYEIIVGAQIDGRVEYDRFRASYLFDSDYLHVNALSAEEAQHPYVPHGVRIVVSPFGFNLIGLGRALTTKLNHDGPPPELLGVPLLSPTYAFGLNRRASRELARAKEAQSPAPLRVIGTTRTLSREYAVALVGTERYTAGEAYHLRLTPLSDPARNRLRDLWIDTASYKMLAIMTQGNFSDGPSTKTKWLTTYQEVDGCRVIDSEIAGGSLDYGPDRKYEKTTIFFNVIDDPAAYRVPIVQFAGPESGDHVTEPDDPATSKVP